MPAQAIHHLLDDAAADVPDAPAVTDSVGTVTYRVLARWSLAVAHWLARAGVAPGERLVVQLPSHRELVAVFHGASRAGIIFVPLNPAMREFHLASVLANADPMLVISEGEHAARLRAVTDVPVRELSEIWPEVMELAEQDLAPLPDPAPDDIAVLIYTSGSTAEPKAVIAPHAQVLFACDALQQVLGYRPDDVIFCRFPLSWDYGLYKVLMTCAGRCHVVLAGEESDLTLVSRMVQAQATIVPIVPSLASMIVSLAARHTDLPPVRMFTNTGAALPAATAAALRRLFPGARVVRQFGQTECKRVSVMPPEQELERPSSVGLPLPATQVLILDAYGAAVAAGEVGEIVVAGPHVMPGYWCAPEITARTFRPDGAGGMRLHTGDYGSLDSDGYLYFEGRRDDMFKRKGIRMSVLEIEAAATDIPGVRAAAVLPPDGGRDLAIVVEGEGLEPRQVLKHLTQRLEPAKVPATCTVVADLPLTQHGKNSREALAALVAQVRT